MRGTPIGRLVAEIPELAARSWFYLTQHGTDYETMYAISRSNGRIVCQTPLLQDYLERIIGPEPERYLSLPPLVPRMIAEAPRATPSGRRLCYVGKFDPHYFVEEMIAGFAQVRAEFPDAELVIAGDKFYDPAGETRAFRKRMTAALNTTEGVSWRGAMPREEVGELVAGCDIGNCWRSPKYDDSLELSTKALEYGAAGLPVLLNPARINRLVFGDDYPLYVDTPESFVRTLARAYREPEVYARAARIAFDTAASFTFEAANRALQPHLAEYRPAATPRRAPDRPHRIVFAGHDLKFARDLIDHFSARPDCRVRIDQWKGHERNDERQSERLLRWADAIWCEWCGGNAVWYSQRVRPSQQLAVRLHRYEMTTPEPEQVRWENVDRLVFIAPHIRDVMTQRLGDAAARVSRLIYNTVNCDRFVRPKSPCAPYTLGC